MIPTLLDEWTLDSIKALLWSGVFESETFDFKLALPNSKDDAGKDRLKAACAAFANADGGFLVFGVADDRELSVEARLKGLDPNADFPAKFGEFPMACQPSVPWIFRNPPIVIPGGRMLHVVHLPRSPRAPHAVGAVDKGWKFPKRSNKGTEWMSIQEIQTSFLGFYEKRLKLELLASELVALREAARRAFIVDDAKMGQEVSLASFELRVLESVVADTYSVTAREWELHAELAAIRQLASICNTKIRLIWSVVHMPLTNKEQLIREHNVAMRPNCEQLVNLSERAIERLTKFLS